MVADNDIAQNGRQPFSHVRGVWLTDAIGVVNECETMPELPIPQEAACSWRYVTRNGNLQLRERFLNRQVRAEYCERVRERVRRHRSPPPDRWKSQDRLVVVWPVFVKVLTSPNESPVVYSASAIRITIVFRLL